MLITFRTIMCFELQKSISTYLPSAAYWKISHARTTEATMDAVAPASSHAQGRDSESGGLSLYENTSG